MMRIKAKQIEVWEREELEVWFGREFPERVSGRPGDEVAAYLNSRAARARELGFDRPYHLRFLIGYEIGCGVPWQSEQEEEESPVVKLLQQRNLTPEQRIEAAERLLYGAPDDGP